MSVDFARYGMLRCSKACGESTSQLACCAHDYRFLAQQFDLCNESRHLQPETEHLQCSAADGLLKHILEDNPHDKNQI